MGHIVEVLAAGFEPRPWQKHLGHRARQVGVQFHEVSDKLPPVRKRRFSRLLSRAAAFQPDLVVVLYDYFYPDEITALKATTGARVVLWFPDSITGALTARFLNAPYDFLFFKDPFIVRMMGDVAQGTVRYLPECFNPDRHRLPAHGLEGNDAYRCDVTTAGNLHSHRVAVFRRLAEFDVKIWGNPPPLWLRVPEIERMYTGRYVANEEKALAFRSAAIVVNTLLPSEIEGVNARMFEVAGIGGFQLATGRPGIEHLFEVGREVVTFDTVADLKDKIRYYLSHEAERTAIAEAGMVRAHREHTYRHRLDLMLATVAGQADGFPMPPRKAGARVQN